MPQAAEDVSDIRHVGKHLEQADKAWVHLDCLFLPPDKFLLGPNQKAREFGIFRLLPCNTRDVFLRELHLR